MDKDILKKAKQVIKMVGDKELELKKSSVKNGVVYICRIMSRGYFVIDTTTGRVSLANFKKIELKKAPTEENLQTVWAVLDSWIRNPN